MWILVLALALLLFWAVGAYGRLARLRAAVHRAFGALDAHQLRLLALLSELEAASGSGATHARAQAARAVLVAAGAGLAEALAVARARPLDAAALDALAAQQRSLAAAWAEWRRSAQPEEGGDASSEDRAQWEQRHAQLEDQLAGVRAAFNEAVERHNAAVAQFPASLLAWLLGLRPGSRL